MNEIPTHQIRSQIRSPQVPRNSTLQGSNLCLKADPCQGAVVFDMGDWSRTVSRKSRVLVQFSLLRSAQPIIEIRLEIKQPNGKWAVQDYIFGGDLRGVSTASFLAPAAPRRYELRVIAMSALRCVDPTNRSFFVDVV